MNNPNTNDMEQEPLDQWIEEQSRKEAEKRVAAMFEVALDGFDEWAARQKRRERVAGTVLAVFLTAFAATAAWHTVPAPGLVAFNMGAASEVREASLLSVYMLDHE